MITQLEQLVEVVPVDGPVIRAAIGSGFRDFEDGLQYFTATSVPLVEAVVTRNPKDFRPALLPVYSPAEAVSLLI